MIINIRIFHRLVSSQFTAITFLPPAPFPFRRTDDLLHNNRKNAGASNHQNHRCQILQPSRSKSAIQAKLFNSSENDHVGQVNFHTDAAEEFRSRILKYPPPSQNGVQQEKDGYRQAHDCISADDKVKKHCRPHTCQHSPIGSVRRSALCRGKAGPLPGKSRRCTEYSFFPTSKYLGACQIIKQADTKSDPGPSFVLQQHAEKRKTQVKYKNQPQKPSHTDDRDVIGQKPE